MVSPVEMSLVYKLLVSLVREQSAAVRDIARGVDLVKPDMPKHIHQRNLRALASERRKLTRYHKALAELLDKSRPS
jgi:hypothetical protein